MPEASLKPGYYFFSLAFFFPPAWWEGKRRTADRGKGWISRRTGDAKNSLIWLCCCLGRTENSPELFDRHNRNYSINPIMTETCQNSCFGKDKGTEGTGHCFGCFSGALKAERHDTVEKQHQLGRMRHWGKNLGAAMLGSYSCPSKPEGKDSVTG